MKHIIFENIYIQNFLSVGFPGISLQFQEGISLITGINLDKDSRNGVGKSTIIESIYWCLFGETIRELKKEQIINNLNKKNCLVTLSFSILTPEGNNQYKLIREAKPTKVTLLENDIDITKSTISKADDFIVSLINSNKDVFQNAVIMTANSTLPFMAQKKGEKRKFIEDMLRLGIFGDMSLQLRSDFSETRKNYEINFDKNQTILNNIKMFNEQHIKQQTDKTDRIDKINNRIKLNEEEILNTEKKLIEINSVLFEDLKNKIQNLPSSVTNKQNNIKILTKAEHEIEFNIKQLNDSISNINNSTDICPACNRKYDSDHIHKNENIILTYKKQIKEFKSKLLKLQNIINKDIQLLKEEESLLTSYINQKHSIDLSIQENTNNNLKIQQILNWNKQLQSDISDIEEEDNSFLSLIQTAQAEQEIVSAEVDKLNKQLKIIDSARFVISEEGVKSFIVKKMLMLLNNKLNHYLLKLEAPCRCYFNEFFEEIIINERGEECSYFNFSGGERKRIDLAVLFMFQDIRRLQSDVKINISMYDELFDSALDERGAECVLNLLKERVYNNKESIYIVSHNKDSVRSGINNIINLEKENGFTRMV